MYSFWIDKYYVRDRNHTPLWGQKTLDVASNLISSFHLILIDMLFKRNLETHLLSQKLKKIWKQWKSDLLVTNIARYFL
jgi:hypothetical protein